jgi:hypothetical protein
MSRKSIKVSEETHEILTSLSQSSKIPFGIMLGYFCDLAEKYDLLNPDWFENAVKERVEEELEKKTSSISEKAELENMKALNRAKNKAFSEYIKVLKPENRKKFLESILGNPDEMLESMHNYKVFYIDGTERWLKFDQEFKPVLEGVSLISCIVGYHIKGNFCECRKWNQCHIRKEEYLIYLGESDPEMKLPTTRRFIKNYYESENQKVDYL